MPANEQKSFFKKYKYQILIPLILFLVAIIAVTLLSMGQDSPFTYATF